MARICCKYFTVSLVPVAALLLAILFAFGILALPIIYTELARKYEYGIVIDAGSSHTTAYIYQLDVPITGKLEELDNHRIDDSINNHADNATATKHIVDRLINLSNQSLTSIKVPSSMQTSISVYLGATAGMRLLRRTNHTAADAIIDITRKAIKASGYRTERRSALVISGTEEAASGWATANYIRGSKKGHVGALDMGGASSEIAYPWPKGVSTNSSYFVKARLMNGTQHLYARSYLCYGHNEALGRFLAHLIDKQHNKTVNVTNPCLARGLIFNYTFSKIYTSCANESIANEVFGFSLYPPSNFSKGHNATFLGTGNTDECQDEIHTVFQHFDCPVEGNCDETGYEFPRVNGTVVGYSGFHYVAEKLNLTGPFNKANLVSSAVLNVCKKDLVNSNNTTMCFFGLFMAYLIESGFGMNSSSHNNWTLEFKALENGQSFGWAMGYFMNMTYGYMENPYHEMFPYTAVDMVVGMLILTILCVIFVVFFFLTFYACKKALKTHEGYQSIS